MMSRKTISIRIAVIGLLVATLGVGFAGPASAQTIYTAYAHQTSVDPVNGGTISFPGALNCAPVTYKGYVRGDACFRPYGDKFYVRDTDADGYRVEMRGLGNWSGTPGFMCVDNSGKAAGWTVCDGWSGVIPENWELVLWATVWDGNTELSAAQWGPVSTC
jgi:hypothetical protein